MEFAIAVGLVYFIVMMRLMRRRQPPTRPIEVVIEPPPPREPPPVDPVPLRPELDRIVREARRHRVN